MEIFGEYFTEIIQKKMNVLHEVMETLLKDAFSGQQNNNFMRHIERYVTENVLPRENDQEYRRYEEKRKGVRRELFDINAIEINNTMSASQDYPFWLKKIKVIEKLFESTKLSDAELN